MQRSSVCGTHQKPAPGSSRPSTLLPWFSATLSPGSTSLQPSATFSGSRSNPTYTAKSSSLLTNHFLPLCLSSTARKSRVRTLAWSSLKHTLTLSHFFLEIFKNSSNPHVLTAEYNLTWRHLLARHSSCTFFFFGCLHHLFLFFLLDKFTVHAGLEELSSLVKRNGNEENKVCCFFCAKSSKLAGKSISIYTLKKSIWEFNWHPCN